MGNKTNTENWSARERLMYVECLAYWRGWVRRADLCEKFGISTPQASADLSAYLLRNPGALQYNLSRKRYEGKPAMRLTFGQGTLEEATSFFGAMASASFIDRVARIDLPERMMRAEITRDLVRAIFSGNPINVYYFSIHSGTEGWRTIRPHAFAHDGYRWHTRAWCEEDGTYKDFVLGRIAKVRAAPAKITSIPFDRDWNTKVQIRFRAHPDLIPVQREALERDFGMVRGIGTLRVRKALLFYTLVYLGLSEPTTVPPRRLQLLGTLKH